MRLLVGARPVELEPELRTSVVAPALDAPVVEEGARGGARCAQVSDTGEIGNGVHGGSGITVAVAIAPVRLGDRPEDAERIVSPATDRAVADAYAEVIAARDDLRGAR